MSACAHKFGLQIQPLLLEVISIILTITVKHLLSLESFESTTGLGPNQPGIFLVQLEYFWNYVPISCNL